MLQKFPVQLNFTSVWCFTCDLLRSLLQWTSVLLAFLCTINDLFIHVWNSFADKMAVNGLWWEVFQPRAELLTSVFCSTPNHRLLSSVWYKTVCGEIRERNHIPKGTELFCFQRTLVFYLGNLKAHFGICWSLRRSPAGLSLIHLELWVCYRLWKSLRCKVPVHSLLCK